VNQSGKRGKVCGGAGTGQGKTVVCERIGVSSFARERGPKLKKSKVR